MCPIESRAVIVGAGLEGLLLGTELARAGWSVDLFERRLVPGGRFASVRHRGFDLERGIHLAPYGSRGALGELLFRQNEPVELRELGRSHAVAGDRVELLPLGLAGLAASPSLKLLDRLRALRLAVNLRSSAGPGASADQDLAGWLQSIRATPSFSRAIRRIAAALLMGVPEDDLSAKELLETFRRGLDRGIIASYPGEGWGRVVARARSRFESYGGRVQLGRRVERVEGDSVQVSGVTDDTGTLYPAGTVIWTGSARGLAQAVPFPVEALDASIECLVPAAGLSASWGLSKPVTATMGIWSIDAPRGWVFFPSNVAPSVAPSGQQSVQAILPWTGTVPDRRTRRRLVDEFQERLDGVFPSFSDRVIFRRTACLSRAQAIDGRVDGGRGDRPPSNLAPPAGLYLVGRESSGPGLGADIGFESVRRCVVDVLGADAVLPTQSAPESTEAGSAVTRTERKVSS